MPVGNIPTHKELAVTFTGAVFFAFYLITLGQTLRWQLFTDEGWQIRRQRNNLILATTVLIFSSTTLYVAFGLYTGMENVYDAAYGHKMPGAVANGWIFTIGECTTANAVALLADTVLMYRCWIVSSKSKLILIFPALMWIGGFICTVIQAYWQAVQTGHFGTGHWEPVNMAVGPGIVLTPFWCTTLALNTYTTAYLVFRILTAAKKFNTVDSPAQPLQLLLRVLGESGVLYFSTTIAHLVVWFTPSNLGIRIISGVNIPTIGIAFNIILIRAAENRAREAKAEETQRNGTSAICYSNNTALSSKGIMPSKGVIVISQQTTMHSDTSDGESFTTLPVGSKV